MIEYQSMIIATDNKQDITWSFAGLTPTDTQYLTHGYHRYPAKFIPQLVQQLIKEYSSPSDRVCDPFGGCGTTLVEAKLSNRVSFGFDINPVAVLITRAKITAIKPDEVSVSFINLCNKLEKDQIINAEITNDRLNLDRLIYWFGETNLKQLIALKSQIVSEGNTAIRRFFLCALSHILKKCSYWLTTSTKPQKDPLKSPEQPVKAFRNHVSRMMQQNATFYEEIQRLSSNEPIAIMRKADARSLPLPENCIDLIITSPPYSTSYEYSDIHQLSALLFGFCASLSDFRNGFIGSKVVNNHQGKNIENSKALTTIQNLRLADSTIANAVHSYYLDMNHVYHEMHRVLRVGGLACIVIGDTELRGMPIPNAEVTAEEMCEIGFILENTIERPVSSRILAPFRDKNNGRFTSPDNPDARKIYSHEYILIFRKK